MALDVVNDALKQLTKSAPSTDSIEDKNTNVQEVFCFEDTVEVKDLKLTVKDVGEMPLPLSEDFIKKIINVSSKAEFGKGEATVLDTNIRDTHMIPANNLTVEIDTDCLENLLTRLKSGLNITQKCTLVPHLHNMLVYGPGQFFKMHRDSEKVPNMVATLVIVLPSFHKGGDLVIQHDNFHHIFFGSQNSNLIKCIIFYSDCLHEIQPVIEGYRVAITYNVVLQPSDDITDVHVNAALNDAVKDYFSLKTKTDKPLKLVYALNHSYSETNLKWGLIKGQDRTQAFALLAVAKKQNLVPCLALGKFRRSYVIDCEEDTLEEETILDYWVDEWNVKFLEDVKVFDEELCFFSKTDDLFKPYKTEESVTGNQGTTVEYWYRRGFVVLLASKWDFSHGYKECLGKFHRSIIHTQEEKETVQSEEINQIRSNIIRVKYWKDPEVIKYLFDIVVHINDEDLAVSILSKLPEQFIQPEKIDLILKLEDQYDNKTWLKIFEGWKSKDWDYYVRYSSFEEASFRLIEEYLKHPSRNLKSVIMKYLSEKHLQQFLNRNKDKTVLFGFVADYLREHYENDSNKTERLWLELKMCHDLENFHLENQLIQHVVGNPKTFDPKTVSEVLILSKSLHPLSSKHVSAYKSLRDAAIKCIEARMSEVKDDNFWKIQKSFRCSKYQCETCSPIKEFLCSTDSQQYCLSANAHVRNHTMKVLRTLEEAHYLKTESSKKPPTLVIKKDQRVFEENKCKAAELKTVKSNLEEMTFLDFKENNFKVGDKSSDTSSTITEEAKMEEPVRAENNVLDKHQEDCGSPSAKRMKNE